jgi:hypothetical protein
MVDIRNVDKILIREPEREEMVYGLVILKRILRK